MTRLSALLLGTVLGLCAYSAFLFHDRKEVLEENAVYEEALTQFSLCWSAGGAVSYDGTQFRCVQGRRTKNLL